MDKYWGNSQIIDQRKVD